MLLSKVASARVFSIRLLTVECKRHVYGKRQIQVEHFSK